MRAIDLFRSAFVAIVVLANHAQAETIEFNSLNASQGYPAVLQGRADYSDKIKGEFTRPKNVNGDVPVMVILHSSAGISDFSTGAWSRFFLDMGVATFVVDSFGPRGFQTSTNDQSVLSNAASTVDALMALKAVSEIPGVDTKRIGAIGFSRGGQATAVSGYKNIRAKVLGKFSDLQFALHVAFYGGCNVPVGTTDGTPMLFLEGDDDDYLAPKDCAAQVDLMRKRGANIDLVVYPGAKHGFDNDRKVVYAAQAQVIKHSAPMHYMDLDSLSYFIEGKEVSPKEYGEVLGKYMTRGVSAGGDAKAAADAHRRVAEFVRKNFAM